VYHALEAGHIDSQGIARSLLAKLDAAQAALDQGQTSTALNQLNAVIREVEAQSAKHINAEHAGHLVEHAQNVVGALGC
jgi:predicted negative regulator of RcsB-dependent stress response